ncbi:MAG TPA: hypothetical protein VFW05_10195 [Verrucomicrobiae bacterium]|nr:hypothetical protein [Verrucomicrobiae bacterium]
MRLLSFAGCICGILILSGIAETAAQPFNIQSAAADIARWMYPYNASPGNRPSASTFAAFGSAPDFDTRDGQFLLGWNTSNSVPNGKGVRNYLIRRAAVTLTISRDRAYAYTGKLRDYRTYFPPDDPRYIEPATSGCPVELFGVGFRGGFSAETFQQTTTFYADPSAGDYTNRTAYAACFDRNGVLVDVSNNVGDDGTNEISNAFEVAPFALGKTIDVAEGELMPAGSQLEFELDLEDPLIYGYVQRALNDGGIRLMASSLINASFGGSATYPDFYTPFSPLADLEEYPLFVIEGTVVRENVDADEDGLPDDWEQFYFGPFGAETAADSDSDGMDNLAEYRAGTNPNDPADAFHLRSIQPASNGTQLEFSFAPNREYFIQWSDSVQQDWHTETNPVLVYTSAWLSKSKTDSSYPSPVYAIWNDTNALSGQRFYRIGVK